MDQTCLSLLSSLPLSLPAFLPSLQLLFPFLSPPFSFARSELSQGLSEIQASAVCLPTTACRTQASLGVITGTPSESQDIPNAKLLRGPSFHQEDPHFVHIVPLLHLVESFAS